LKGTSYVEVLTVFKACRAWTVVGLLSLFLVSSPAHAWQQTPLPQPTLPGEGPPPDREAERMRKEQEKRINKARQETLKKDTDQLVKLANELKQYVDKTNENMLSLEVLHKAEEIEKLAKTVKDKMKGN
jgi:hypothetical protein